jgi:hypothetical protein
MVFQYMYAEIYVCRNIRMPKYTYAEIYVCGMDRAVRHYRRYGRES